MFSTSAFEAVS